MNTCHANLHSARMSICEGKALVATTQKPYFQVQSTDGSAIYAIHIDKPSCSCLYFKKQFLPCKHIFILLEVGHIHWEDLPHSYRNMPHIVVDDDIVNCLVKHEQEDPTDVGNDKLDISNKQTSRIQQDMFPQSSHSLKRNRRRISSLMEKIQERIHYCTDRKLLDSIVNQLVGINDSITQSIPTDQGLFVDHTNIIKFKVKKIKPLPKHNQIKKINKHNKRKGTN